MIWQNPSHQKAYWVCARSHEPPGIVQHGDELGYAIAPAIVDVTDYLGTGTLATFETVDGPSDVAGVVPDLVLERLQECYEFKQDRERTQHEDTGGEDEQDDTRTGEQAELAAWVRDFTAG